MTNLIGGCQLNLAAISRFKALLANEMMKLTSLFMMCTFTASSRELVAKCIVGIKQEPCEEKTIKPLSDCNEIAEATTCSRFNSTPINSCTTSGNGNRELDSEFRTFKKRII